MCRVALRQIHWYHSEISNHVINSLWCLQRIEHELSMQRGLYILLHIHLWHIGPLDVCIHTTSMRLAILSVRMCSSLNQHRFVFHLIPLICFITIIVIIVIMPIRFQKKKSGQQPTTVCHFKWQNKHVALCDLLYFSRIFWVRLIELIGHVEMW